VLVPRGVVPKTKILHSDPTMSRSFKSIHYLELVFRTYHVMFKEKKGGGNNISAKRIKTIKNTKMLFSGRALELFAKSFFPRGSCNINP
jgi:hypothetical protein